MKKEKPNSNATDSASPKRGEAVLLFAAIGGTRARNRILYGSVTAHRR